jgi:hypothetical protein
MSIIEERLVKLEEAAAAYLKDMMGRNLTADIISPACRVEKRLPCGSLMLKCHDTHYLLTKDGLAYMQRDRPATAFLNDANPGLAHELYEDLVRPKKETGQHGWSHEQVWKEARAAEHDRRAKMTPEAREMADATWKLQHPGKEQSEYLVVDDEFNQKNYPAQVGQLTRNPPAGAHVRAMQ